MNLAKCGDCGENWDDETQSLACPHPRLKVLTVCPKCKELARLLIECRDALPAITIERARLYNVSLSLADRIEAALKPWEVKEGGI